MPSSSLPRLQRLWRNVHLCVGASLLLLLGAIALSGALLIWKTPLDMTMHPGRYAITPGDTLPPSSYLAQAAARGLEPVAVRYPDNGGSGPVVITARAGSVEPGGRPNIVTVYLDPPSGRVLDVVDVRTSLFGTLHRFHENLTIPDYDGRSIVGWTGVAMLTSVLTGIYLWWPRGGGLRRGLRWRRGPGVLSNLHHMVGIWIAIPLAVVAATGIYLGFPAQGRSLIASVFAMAPSERGAFAAPLLHPTSHSIDQALDLALATTPGAKPVAVSLPTKQQGNWRVELYDTRSGDTAIVTVDDATGAVKGVSRPLAGDRVASWLRWIHEGSHAGLPWRLVVFLCGLAPPILGVSGVIVWLRRRSLGRSEPLRDMQPRLGAAE